MNESGRLISADFLLRLANNDLTSEEILKLYFKYYFCPGEKHKESKIRLYETKEQRVQF